MKLESLYSKLPPEVWPIGLRRIYEEHTSESVKSNLQATYSAVLLEAKASEGLFWIVPDKEGWTLLHFPRNYFHQSNHIELWREVAADIVLKAWDKTGGAGSVFYELYRAYPRGRLVAEDIGSPSYQKGYRWWIGFGGDYPPGWDDEKLLRRMGVGPKNTQILIDKHWLADPKQRREADAILHEAGQLVG